MSELQKRLLLRIQEERAAPRPDQKAIRKLARLIAAEDDRTEDLRKGFDPGGRSRSPSFGKWGED